VLDVLESLERRGASSLAQLARDTGAAKSTLHLEERPFGLEIEAAADLVRRWAAESAEGANGTA
jgi:hypothetical protein